MRTLSLHLAAALVLAGPPLRADLLDPAVVDRDAYLLIHLDVDALKRTRLFEHALAEAKPRFRERLAEFEAETGLDPLEDVRSVTVYGLGAREERLVALLSTSPRLDGAIARLAERPEYRRLEVEGRALHVLVDGDRAWYGHAFQPGADGRRLFAITEDERAMLDAIAVVEGRRASLAGAAEAAVASLPSPGAVLFLSASRHFDEIGRFEQAAEVSRLLRGVELEAGEAGGEAFGTLRLRMGTEDDALAVHDVAQGIIGLRSLLAGGSKDAPRLRAMLRALRVDRSGTRVTIAFRMPAGVLVEELRGAASDDGR